MAHLQSSLIRVSTSNGVAVALLSILAFWVTGQLVRKCLTPKGVRKSHVWRWKNISVSLVHSVLSGYWCVTTFYYYPKLMEDMIHSQPPRAYYLICMSLGYFIYDAIDMLANSPLRKSYELVFHHVVIILCFCIAITYHLYVGYACSSLIVELNSVFLHSRQLLLTLGMAKGKAVYRTVSLTNVGTFIIFRFVLIGWMIRWILTNKDLVPIVFYSVGAFSLAVIFVMNIVLFVRLLFSDFTWENQKVDT